MKLREVEVDDVETFYREQSENRDFWGRGVATAALTQFLEVVEDRPLYAWVARHKAGSIRVLERAGFVFAKNEGDHSVYKIG